MWRPPYTCAYTPATASRCTRAAYLDRQLAEIKKLLLSREDAIVLLWNLDTQAKLYYYLLDEWLKNLQKQTARYDGLFLEKNFLLGYHEVAEGAPVIQTAPALPPLLDSASFVFNNTHELLRQFTFGISWQVFRLRGHTLNLNLLVNFHFDNYGFQVRYHINELSEEDFYVEAPAQTALIYDTTYREKYDQDHIAHLNHELASKLFQYLKEHLPPLV
jgi:hypothetical protein